MSLPSKEILNLAAEEQQQQAQSRNGDKNDLTIKVEQDVTSIHPNDTSHSTIAPVVGSLARNTEIETTSLPKSTIEEAKELSSKNESITTSVNRQDEPDTVIQIFETVLDTKQARMATDKQGPLTVRFVYDSEDEESNNAARVYATAVARYFKIVASEVAKSQDNPEQAFGELINPVFVELCSDAQPSVKTDMLFFVSVRHPDDGKGNLLVQYEVPPDQPLVFVTLPFLSPGIKTKHRFMFHGMKSCLCTRDQCATLADSKHEHPHLLDSTQAPITNNELATAEKQSIEEQAMCLDLGSVKDIVNEVRRGLAKKKRAVNAKGFLQHVADAFVFNDTMWKDLFDVALGMAGVGFVAYRRATQYHQSRIDAGIPQSFATSLLYVAQSAQQSMDPSLLFVVTVPGLIVKASIRKNIRSLGSQALVAFLHTLSSEYLFALCLQNNYEYQATASKEEERQVFARAQQLHETEEERTHREYKEVSRQLRKKRRESQRAEEERKVLPNKTIFACVGGIVRTVANARGLDDGVHIAFNASYQALVAGASFVTQTPISYLFRVVKDFAALLSDNRLSRQDVTLNLSSAQLRFTHNEISKQVNALRDSEKKAIIKP